MRLVAIARAAQMTSYALTDAHAHADERTFAMISRVAGSSRPDGAGSERLPERPHLSRIGWLLVVLAFAMAAFAGVVFEGIHASHWRPVDAWLAAAVSALALALPLIIVGMRLVQRGRGIR